MNSLEVLSKVREWAESTKAEIPLDLMGNIVTLTDRFSPVVRDTSNVISLFERFDKDAPIDPIDVLGGVYEDLGFVLLIGETKDEKAPYYASSSSCPKEISYAVSKFTHKLMNGDFAE